MNYRKSIIAVVAILLSLVTASVSAFTIDRQFAGYWVEKDLDTRRGWGLEYIPTGPEAGVIFMAGFVYNDMGEAFWVSGVEPVVPGEFEVSIKLNTVKGGVFGPEAGNPVNDNENWGTMNIEFMDCNNAKFTWTDTPFGSGDNPFEPISNVTRGNTVDKCVYQKPFTACPAFSTPAASERTCVLSGTYLQDITLTNDTLWVLSGGVFIGEKDAMDNDYVLTIEAGTRIIGAGADTDLLVISRGSKIIAQGQPYAPIVLSGPKTASDGAAPGDWGGLAINGFAPLNTCDTPPCTALGEGDSGTYGGVDPHDSSGIIRYFRVQFAGKLFSDENELNGISLQGVGDGTVFEYVQVHGTSDDGFEWYGGTVNGKYLVATFAEDDSFDWTMGYSGKLQFGIIKQNQDETVGTDRGMELDNLEQNNDATPRAQPQVANLTIIGRPNTLGINPRRGTGGNFTNMIVTGFNTCLNIDSAATFAAAGTPANLTGVLTFENTIFDCATNFAVDGSDPWTTADFINAQEGNEEIDSNLNGVLPPAGASYLSGKNMDPEKFDDFFDKVDWAGAVRSADAAWYHGWTIFVD